MILNIILWYPSARASDLMKEVIKLPKPPAFVKKWQTLQTSEGKDGFKQYNIIFIEKGKGDEALVELIKMLKPIFEKDYVETKVEVLLSARDSVKALT